MYHLIQAPRENSWPTRLSTETAAHCQNVRIAAGTICYSTSLIEAAADCDDQNFWVKLTMMLPVSVASVLVILALTSRGVMMSSSASRSRRLQQQDGRTVKRYGLGNYENTVIAIATLNCRVYSVILCTYVHKFLIGLVILVKFKVTRK